MRMSEVLVKTTNFSFNILLCRVRSRRIDQFASNVGLSHPTKDLLETVVVVQPALEIPVDEDEKAPQLARTIKSAPDVPWPT